MKKILFRKLFFDYLIFLILALFSTSLVIWVFQAVNFLDIIIEDGRDYIVYLKFTLLNFPKILSKILPFTLFFSLFYVTTRYELNNELVIFWNFGLSKLQIVNFAVKISILVLILQLLMTSIIIPSTQDKARSFLRSSTLNYFGNFIKPQKFNDTIKGITIYSEKKDLEGNLFNLYIKREINKNEFQITYAKKGTFTENTKTPVLVLNEGATINSKNNKITNISFSKSDFSLANIKTNTITTIKTQELSSIKIIKCINYFYKLNKEDFKIQSANIQNCSEGNIINIFKEFYKRFILPFYLLLLSLIPFLLILNSKENLKYNKFRLIIFLVGLFFIIFSETTVRIISEKLTTNIILIFFPIMLFMLFYIFFIFKFKNN